MIKETKKLIISKELKSKIEFICKFANVNYTLTNGNIKSIKNTNIAYVKPHILRVKETDYLIFEECENIFINNFNNKIKLKDLENHIKGANL